MKSYNKIILNNNLIYLNFHTPNHIERKKCYEYFSDKEWCFNQKNRLSFEEYFIELSGFKYSICPRGAGIDTHRIYESIFTNTIPIVNRNELSDLYEKLPVFLINDWEEINFELLNKKYDELYKNLLSWKEKNKNWIESNFWLNS